MRLRHIEIFNAVYATGSISSAARLLNITQPTASKVLKHAEDQLGFLLFERVKGRLIPTREADTLFLETSQIYKKITSLKKTTQNLQNSDEGVIRLAVVHALGLELLPSAIAKYNEKHPNVQFQVQTHHYDNVLAAVNEHDKDIGIALNPPEVSGITHLDFAAGEFVCIYFGNEFDHHPGRLSLADLEGFPFISIDDSGPLAELIKPEMEKADIICNSVIKAQTYFLARNLVAAGVGVSIVDDFTARSKGAGKVKYKGFDPPLRFSVKAMYLEKKAPSQLSQNFLDFFRSFVLDSSV